MGPRIGFLGAVLYGSLLFGQNGKFVLFGS